MILIFKILIILTFSLSVISREIGETEITTEDGIEVFQNEKYYLLKKNVIIKSDNFSLNADIVKINFNKSLYDIVELNAEGTVDFNSNKLNLSGFGETLKFEVLIEKLKVEGDNSKLVTEDIEMYSDGFIEVNNQNGKFFLKGKNSRLNSENIFIKAEKINGIFSNETNRPKISFLDVSDNELSYVKNNDTEMYAKKIKFNSDTSIIELFNNVTIIRNEERITGDYGTLDTKNNSYKIKSNNQSNVKVIIKNNEQ
tara:strand:+ start:1018 stop:1782 length:765 start_codon:yes stop_codon:yes gene_type:complete